MTNNDNGINGASNGRVRDVEIRHIRSMVEELKVSHKEDLRELKIENDRIKELLQKQIDSNIRLSERVNLFQAGQGLLTLLATSIGIYLASR